MKVLILQHIACETPGYIKDLMIDDKINFETIQLDEGHRIPDNLDNYDAMFCMGGPMDTWMEDKYPWLIEEKNKIKHYVEDLEKPYLGFCLGCQLLGEVIGGTTIKSSPAEIGILKVNLSDKKKSDKIFYNFPKTINVLQWHSYEVSGLENNQYVTLLGSSPTTKYQIFKYKDHAYGIQFHIEIKSNTVSDWGCIPEYEKSLEASLGSGALNKFDKLAKENLLEMNKMATFLYENFKKNYLSSP